MTMTSERDVAFTPFMLRVRAVLNGDNLGGDNGAADVRLRTSSLQPLANANDGWSSLRARAEQVIAEANGMLRGRAQLVALEDEVGTGTLAFTLGHSHRSVRIWMGRAHRQGWVQLERSYSDDVAPSEPVALEELEDLVIELIALSVEELDGGR